MRARSMWRMTVPAVLAGVLCLLPSACGGSGESSGALGEPDAPVGTPVLPDLVPSPQLNVLTRNVKGRWLINFDTILTNVGEGDFVLRATREIRGTWKAEQDIPYSEGGAKRVRVRSPLVWGGDGHNHWHIVRIASVQLVPLDPNGKPTKNARVLVDSKVGFCFYDHTHELPRGPAEPQFSAKSCGKQDAAVVGMGLSPGWNDTYVQSLPGQTIDVTGLPDGKYRLYTSVNEQGWFHEVTRGNNRTWIDLDLRMTPQGLVAPMIGTGPTPS